VHTEKYNLHFLNKSGHNVPPTQPQEPTDRCIFHSRTHTHTHTHTTTTSLYPTMADEEDIAALVIDNGSGMCKG
jgi:hypothetical protein